MFRRIRSTMMGRERCACHEGSRRNSQLSSRRNREIETSNPTQHDQHMTITKSDSKFESREKIKKSFERNGVLMTVSEESILPARDEHADDMDSCRGLVVLPRSKEDYGTALVINHCVICLESYQPGHVVVWSSNPDCQHAFHRTCALRFLIRIQKRVAMTPCCICRCQFTDLTVERRDQVFGRRRRGERALVRTSHNFDALDLPSWITSRRRPRSPTAS